MLSLTTGVLFAQFDTYDSLWNDPEVVHNIENNIEQFRKGDAIIEIIGRDGKPVSDATVHVKQQTHEFLFGCNLFVLGQLNSNEMNAKYEKAFSNLFNFATIPFYWKELEPEQGNPRFAQDEPFIWRRPAPDRLIDWCYTHNITPKGHCLMYIKDMMMPDWTAKHDPELLLQQGRKHMADIAEHYQDKMPIWDVANEEHKRKREPQYWHDAPEHYLQWCFREANDLFPPNVDLLYNEGKHAHDALEEYMDNFRILLKNDIDVDGMGIHVHFWNEQERSDLLAGKQYPPEKLIADYEKLAELDLPLYITEVTIPGMGENGDEIQANIVEKMYRLWFSTPQMAGITWWNLGDNTAYGNENTLQGGLMDENMDPKPAYKVLNKLINHEWKTKKLLHSDNSGNVQFRGFYGKYKIKVKYGGKIVVRELSLMKSGNNHFTIQL